jgi:hypothetical protein
MGGAESDRWERTLASLSKGFPVHAVPGVEGGSAPLSFIMVVARLCQGKDEAILRIKEGGWGWGNIDRGASAPFGRSPIGARTPV